ncbi:MAG TPA: hypothetical protein VHM91_10770 [Verrucomicrobiales bacterium]|jgi:acyl carrier protein|nr:hypothetical protein [Verrucomicrobiales bacterium]
MGLDSVQIIIDTEKEFQIEISDGEAGQIETAGQLFDLVREKAGISPALADTRLIWQRLVKVITGITGTPVERIRPTSRFIEDLGVD